MHLIGEEALVIVDAMRGQRLVDVLNAVATVGVDEVTMKGFSK